MEVLPQPLTWEAVAETATGWGQWCLANPLGTAFALLVAFVFMTWPMTLPAGTPGPCKNVPYFGAAFEVLRNIDRLPEYIAERNREYGFKGVTWAGRMPRVGLLSGMCVFVNSPECIKHVLADNFSNYVKGYAVAAALREFLGDGIFVADGDLWKTHRKVASHMFSRRLLRESCVIANDYTSKLLDRLRTSSGQAVDVQELYFKLTIDIFTYIAFGVDLDSLSREQQHPFAQAFDEVQMHSEKRFYNPLWWPIKLFQLSPGERAITRGVRVVNEFATDVISKKRRQLAQSESLGPDLLSRFLENAKANEETLTNKELRDIVMNFMIAGRDTTACALSWTMYELADKPDVQQRIRAEFSQVCGETLADGKMPTLELVGELRYMHAVAQETLRLHPSVPKDVKFAVRDDVLPDGTKIQGGCCVLYSPYAIGRDPTYWEEPEVFKPDRFIGVSEPSQFKYPAFNAGPRVCLGKPLAMMEIKLVTALVLHHFDIKLAEPHPGTYTSTLVLPMRPGLKMVFTPRESKPV